MWKLYDVKYWTAGVVAMVPYRITNDLKAIRGPSNSALYVLDEVVIDTLIALRNQDTWFHTEFDDDGTIHFYPVPNFEVIPGPLGKGNRLGR